MKPIKNTLFSSLIGLSLLLFNSCGSSSEKSADESTEKQATVANNPAAQVAQKQFYYINTAGNEKLAEITTEGEDLIISLANSNLFGELKRADKRKYVDQSDQLKYTVKYKEDGFKLNDQNEALLWKIKLYDDHIKVADNNEMENSYRVGLSGTSKIKLKKDDDELAALILKPGDPFVQVKEHYIIRNFGNSLALGILLIDEIPDEEKYIICAELLKKEK
ncbi:MAG: hypothetical protein AAF363_07505 [Bacteroidota bacterium]